MPTQAWAPKPIKTPAYTPPQKPWVKLGDLKARHTRAAQLARAARGRWPADGRVRVGGARHEAVEALSSRHARVVRGRRGRGAGRDRRAAAVHGDARIAREHSAADDLLARDDRRQRRACGSSSTSRGAKTLFPQEVTPPPPPPRDRHGCRSRSTARPAATTSSTSRTSTFTRPREEREVHGRPLRARRQVGDAGDLRAREEPAAAGSRATRGTSIAESAEFWLVFAGQIRYAFEGQQPFVASEGDVVYVPASTWHATRFIGPDPSCRLSITEYVGNTLVLEPKRP